MGGRTRVGHKGIYVPLSRTHPRHAPKNGWDLRCKCGWTGGNFPIRIIAERAYSQHILNHLPICGTCGDVKSVREMSKASPHRCKACSRKAMKDWIAKHPKQYERCRRASHMRKKYGITLSEYDAIVQAQAGLCPICRRVLSDTDPRGFRPHVDHCHETGKTRGVLCGRCNRGLGTFKDSIVLMRNAIEYLESK